MEQKVEEENIQQQQEEMKNILTEKSQKIDVQKMDVQKMNITEPKKLEIKQIVEEKIEQPEKKYSFENKKTADNLIKAYRGETKGSYFYNKCAEIADYYNPLVKKIFEKTSINEKTHASLLKEIIDNSDINPFTYKIVNDIDDLGTLIIVDKDSVKNLEEAVKDEQSDILFYKEAGDKATLEGFNEIGILFKILKSIEEDHEKTFLTLLACAKYNLFYQTIDNNPCIFQCENCGRKMFTNKAIQCTFCKELNKCVKC